MEGVAPIVLGGANAALRLKIAKLQEVISEAKSSPYGEY
jgi:hypothetical protein